MSKELLECASRMLQNGPDMIYYFWYGKIFSEAHPFMRLDKTYLNVLRMTSDGPKIQRILGYLDNTSPNNPHIVYSTKAVYRILEGPRKGRIVPPSKIRETEKAVMAGVCKKLTLDNTPGSLSIAKEADRFLLDSIQGLLENESHFYDSIQLPTFYLCCAKTNNILIPRTGGNSFQYFLNLEGFDSQETINNNLKKLKTKIAVDAGENMVAYNYSYVYGKGVIAVDPEINSRWFSILRSNAKIEEEHITVSLVDEENLQGLHLKDSDE